MTAFVEWLADHWLPVLLILGLAAAVIFVSVMHKSLFYKE